MGIDDARDQHLVCGEDDLLGRLDHRVERPDRHDVAVVDRNAARLEPVTDQHLPAAKDQIDPVDAFGAHVSHSAAIRSPT